MVRLLVARTAAVVSAVGLLTWGLATPGTAETPSPGPGPTAATSATATPAPDGPPASPTPNPNPSTTTTARTDGPDLTLVVAAVGGPVADELYEDLGSFGFSGTTGLADGVAVAVQRRGADGTWRTVAETTAQDGAYAVEVLVEAAGEATFRAAAAGPEGVPVASPWVSVTVRSSSISLTAPAEVDSLADLPVTGRVVPARAGVTVYVDVHRGSRWKNVATATTAPDGSWTAPVGYGRSELERYELRATHQAVNRPRWERTTTSRFARIAVLDPQVDATTADDVAKTYRTGCPVGPSKLSTIHLNHYGRDDRMHRGVIIVRTDLRQEIIRGFEVALEHRFPVAKMENPNAYGGNDPQQMKANNTSGFNCRKVVGNPYKMSPHSYGIAIDVNTVQNPYRDSRGKWWPSSSKKYRDRTPLRRGMLGKKSTLTKSLRSDDFFWGGLWNPGRDYQHFEYRG